MSLLYDYYFCFMLHIIFLKDGIEKKVEWIERQPNDMVDWGWNNTVLSYCEFLSKIRHPSF